MGGLGAGIGLAVEVVSSSVALYRVASGRHDRGTPS